VIIDRGRIMAEDTLAGLRRRLQQGTRLRIEVRGPEAQAREALGRIARVRVEAASDEGPGAGDSEEHGYWLTAERGHDPRPEVAAALTARGLGLLELRSQPVSLEEIFCRITGERPADSADSAALAIPLPPASDHSPPASDRAPPDDGA
jgi:ABC-type multidrug transport system ATPase subunit